MKQVSRYVLIFSIIFLLLFAIGCSSKKVEDTFVIGGAFALTGFGAGWGEVERNGVNLALEEINADGKKFVLVTEDIGQEQTKAVSAVKKLIEVDDVNVIIGTTWLDTFGGAAPFADEHELVMITPSASISAIKEKKEYQYVFSTWYRTDKEVKKLVEHLANTGKTKVVLSFGNDPFWQDVVKNFKEFSKETEIEIIKEFKYNSGEEDFRTPLTQMKELTPDAILFGLNDDSGLHAFLKQKNELYPNAVLYTTEYIEEFATKESFEDLVNNVFFIAPKPADNDFSKKYEEMFGKTPLLSASNAYDATKIIAQAVTSGALTGPEIREYLLTHEFDTVTFGKVKFDTIGGIASGEFVVKHIIDGSVEIKE